MPNRMYFLNGQPNPRIAAAHDFSGTAQTGDNISISTTSGIQGLLVIGERLYFLENTNNTAIAYDFDGNAQSSDNKNLLTILGETSIDLRGGTVTDDRIVILLVDGTVKFLNHSWVYQSSEDISLGTGNWQGVVASDDHYYFIDDTNNTGVAYDFRRTAQSSNNISLGTGNWTGGARSDNRLHFTDNSSDTTDAYDFSRARQSSDDITFSSGFWRGGATRFEEVDATLTVSTTETNLYTGKTFDIDITSDVDISNFALSDVTVTGGTANSLTETDAQNFVLNVTAGAVGTMNVDIAADVVTPGNTAVDADFTIVARATVAIAFDDDDVETSDSADATVTFSEAPEGLDTSDFSVNVGTIESVTGSGTTRTVRVTAPSSGSGTITLTLAADSIDQGNLEASDTIDYAPPSDALTVAISGTTNIEQGETTILSAAVTNPDGLTITSGLTYAWTATRGSFPNGATGASVTYEADFTESSDVNVDITCTVTRTANASPTVSTGSLTAMADLGITGQILNMYIDETEASANGSNTVFYAESSSDSSLAAGSDDDVSSTIHIWRIQWHASNNWFILNANGTGNLSTFFSSNTAQSIYVVFSDGTHYEITNAEYDNGGSSWSRWAISDADIRTKFDNLGADDTLLVGVGAADAIGYNAGSGSDDATVTATAAAGLPSAPQNLTATADANGTRIDLDWDAPSDNGGSAITEYEYRYAEGTSVPSGTSWTETDSTDTAITITGLSKGTEYTFEVRAVNANGSGTSASVTETTETTVPSAPTGLSVTVTRTTATLSWTAPSDNGGTPITDYEVSSDDGANWTSTGSTTPSHIITGLTANTEYDFKVRAVNAEGEGTASATVTETTSPLSVPNPVTNLAVTHTHEEATITWDNPTDTGGTTLTDIELRITTGSTPGGNWQALGVVETHTESGLTAETEYTVEVRAENSEGYSTSNPNETFTTNAAPGEISIEAIDEVFITVGTENYELDVEVYGNPTNASAKGVYEGFSSIWDPDAAHSEGTGTGIVTIKIPEAVRLTMDQIWTVHADTVSREIIYNVISAAPVITDPGDLVFFRGAKNRKFIQVSNNPDTVNVGGDLVGLTHAPGIDEDGNSGVFVAGEVDEDDDFGKTDFQFSVDATNEGGDDDVDVDFDVLDVPKMFLGGYEGTTRSLLLRVDADTINNGTATVFPFSAETGFTNPRITGLLIDGDDMKILARPFSGTERTVLTLSKDAEEGIAASSSRTDDISAISADPRGIAAPVNSLRQGLGDYYVVDGTSRRIHLIVEGNSGLTQQGSGGLLPSNLTSPRGIFIDSNEDAYIVDLTTRRVNVVDEAGSGNSNILTTGTISIDRYFILPTGCNAPGDIFVDDDYVYIIDYADRNENFAVDTGETAGLQCQVFVMDKDTANAATATAVRVFSLPTADTLWTQAIYIDAA